MENDAQQQTRERPPSCVCIIVYVYTMAEDTKAGARQTPHTSSPSSIKSNEGQDRCKTTIVGASSCLCIAFVRVSDNRVQEDMGAANCAHVISCLPEKQRKQGSMQEQNRERPVLLLRSNCALIRLQSTEKWERTRLLPPRALHP